MAKKKKNNFKSRYVGGNVVDKPSQPTTRNIKPLNGPIHPGFEQSAKPKQEKKKVIKQHLEVSPQTYELYQRKKKKK